MTQLILKRVGKSSVRSMAKYGIVIGRIFFLDAKRTRLEQRHFTIKDRLGRIVL